MNAIQITNLNKTFRGKKGATVKALQNVAFSVMQGEVFGFLGPNGAGKSTTIKILMGLIRPTSGKTAIMSHDANSHLARKQVGYLPENPSFYDYLTADEYLAFVGKIFKMNSVTLAQKSKEILELLDLWEARKRPIRSYSKGMVQRLGLAQTLIHDPDVYILDEPMSGLDPGGRALVKQVISDLRAKGKCVFFSTHITADVESVCDRVGILVGGVLQCVERVDAILAEGINGYILRVEKSGEGQKQLEVSKEEIGKTIVDLESGGQEIVLIEPKKKSLESFFLDLVKGKG